MRKVYYRAIHTKNPWRKVSSHSSVEKALRGKDGAAALLEGRARIDYEKHGQPLGVVVWDESGDVATAIRMKGQQIEFRDFSIDIAWEAEQAGGISSSDFDRIFHHEGQLFPDQASLVEGAAISVEVNRYERNAEARRACIAHWGSTCCVCGFDFEARYGERGFGFIHVHHIVPLSQIEGEYEIDPISDLRPVCPNCHAMIHRFEPALSVEELRADLRGDA